MHAADRFANRPDVVQSILVIAPEDREHFTEKFGGNAALLGIEVVEGGNERYDSVARALEQVLNGNDPITAPTSITFRREGDDWKIAVFHSVPLEDLAEE